MLQYSLYLFAGASIRKHHRLGGLNSRILLSHNSEGREIRVLANLVSPEASLLADGHLLPVSSHRHPSVLVYVLISSSFNNTSHIGLRPIPMISINLITSLKPCLQLQSDSEELEVKMSAYKFEGT